MRKREGKREILHCTINGWWTYAQYTIDQETFAIQVKKNVNAEILLINGKSYTQICTITD